MNGDMAMFSADTYMKRRELLQEKLSSGLVLLPGNGETPMNYPANPYFFCQDSTFLYFFGINKPDLYGVIDLDSGVDSLFGTDLTIDDVIWMGTQPSVKELAEKVGVNDTGELSELSKTLSRAQKENRKIHFLAPYRTETLLKLADWLCLDYKNINGSTSVELIESIVTLRSRKSAEELAQIEAALAISANMYNQAMRALKPGIVESELVGLMEGVVGANNSHISFPTILSVHGEILHNHFHGNIMNAGDLLVIDSGAKSPEHYASDITRTLPVSGTFSIKQKEIYQIVLDAQMSAIDAIKPGATYRSIHLFVSETIAKGLTALGIMKGDPREAVRAGAHALFFPHGLGHMLGLDVHDMENFGENYVGYDKGVTRSEQFGLAYLRLARALETGFVLTVEPGIYFIPALIDKWEQEKKHTQFIQYEKLREYRDFGGIRIEDDLVVTESGSRVLGTPIPKTIEELENILG